MASGCAAVASRAGGIPEIITTEVDGLLVPPGDAPALAAALRRLLADASLLNRLRGRAPATICKRFSRASVARETLAAYDAALS
jgi:glycosyltransferase involved in cell wall biosynthesis